MEWRIIYFKNKLSLALVIFITFLSIQTIIKANETVKLKLLCKNQFEFAGFYITKGKGFYKDLGLDVEIKEYQSRVDIVDDVLTQKSDVRIG